jgi:general secretion pathway protein L
MNLHTTINFDLKRFWIWWIDELSFFVPKKIKSLMVDQSGVLVITENNNKFDLAFFEKNEHHPFITTSLEINGNEDFLTLKQKYPYLEKAEVVLVLKDEKVIKKIITLPLAVYDSLQQVISFELNRFTPFGPEQVYFVALPIGKTDYGQINVLLVLTPQQVLDDLILKLNQLHIFPDKVDCDNFNHNKQDYDLLPDKYRPVENYLNKTTRWITVSALVFLALLVLIMPVWRQSHFVDVLSEKIKANEKQFNHILQQQAEIQALNTQTQALIDLKNNTPVVIIVLNELTNLLSNDTWLTNFQLIDNKIQIQGVSPNASALIGLLEKSAIFNNVVFVSPITQDKNSGKERFQIIIELAPPNKQASENGVPNNE